MSKKISKTSQEFFLSLEKYVKHKSLELELTLRNGEQVVIKGSRKIVGGEIVVLPLENVRVPLKQIKSAQIYAC